MAPEILFHSRDSSDDFWYSRRFKKTEFLILAMFLSKLVQYLFCGYHSITASELILGYGSECMWKELEYLTCQDNVLLTHALLSVSSSSSCSRRSDIGG